jgi:hypothetical protein
MSPMSTIADIASALASKGQDHREQTQVRHKNASQNTLGYIYRELKDHPSSNLLYFWS